MMDFEKVHDYENYFSHNNVSEILKRLYFKDFKAKKKRRLVL